MQHYRNNKHKRIHIKQIQWVDQLCVIMATCLLGEGPAAPLEGLLKCCTVCIFSWFFHEKLIARPVFQLNIKINANSVGSPWDELLLKLQCRRGASGPPLKCSTFSTMMAMTSVYILMRGIYEYIVWLLQRSERWHDPTLPLFIITSAQLGRCWKPESSGL